MFRAVYNFSMYVWSLIAPWARGLIEWLSAEVDTPFGDYPLISLIFSEALLGLLVVRILIWSKTK